MLNTITIFLFLFLCFSCRDVNECTDVDFGPQYISDSTYSLFAYKGGESLIFKDSLNHELVFQMTPIPKVYPTWTSIAQDVNEGSGIGKMQIKSDLQALSTNFESDSLTYQINYAHHVNSMIEGANPIFYDFMVAFMYDDSELPTKWSIYTGHLLDSKGNDVYLANKPVNHEYAVQLTLNNKSFEKVYFNTEPDGSALYFNHSLGFIGFREANKPLWVLDRIE